MIFNTADVTMQSNLKNMENWIFGRIFNFEILAFFAMWPIYVIFGLRYCYEITHVDRSRPGIQSAAIRMQKY